MVRSAGNKMDFSLSVVSHPDAQPHSIVIVFSPFPAPMFVITVGPVTRTIVHRRRRTVIHGCRPIVNRRWPVVDRRRWLVIHGRGIHGPRRVIRRAWCGVHHTRNIDADGPVCAGMGRRTHEKSPSSDCGALQGIGKIEVHIKLHEAVNKVPPI